MKTKWSYVFFVVIIIDALTTIYLFGEEANPIILWTMKVFDLSLEGAMIAKIIYSFPLLFFVDYFGRSKWVIIALISYIGVYVYWLVGTL